MGEFDESYDSESVDISSDSSFESPDVEDFDTSSEDYSSDSEGYEDSSTDTFEEDTSEAEYAEQQAEAEAESNAEYAEQQAETEAESNAEYAEDTATATDNNDGSYNDGNDSNDDDYHVFIDGKEVDPTYDPLEGTKMEIGHSEYDDAQLAYQFSESEAYNEACHDVQINATAKSLGAATPFAGSAMKNEFDRLHQMEENDNEELERMAEYHHWSHDSYNEEYNP